jgi:hypothetical protein
VATITSDVTRNSMLTDPSGPGRNHGSPYADDTEVDGNEANRHARDQAGGYAATNRTGP